jgi:hypothetical protein
MRSEEFMAKLREGVNLSDANIDAAKTIDVPEPTTEKEAGSEGEEAAAFIQELMAPKSGAAGLIDALHPDVAEDEGDEDE